MVRSCSLLLRAASERSGSGTRAGEGAFDGSGVPASGRAIKLALPGACVALVCGWLLLFGAQAASAQITNTGSFGSSGTGDGQFSSPGGVAVDQATGDVYVADSGNARIEKFDSAGNFLSAWGWGVADGASMSQVCTNACQQGTPGSGAGQFSDPVNVAVDNNPSSSSYEDVYVADQGDNVIERFNSSGKYLSSITGPNGGSFSTVVNVATDASGNVWAYDENSNVDEFTPSGKKTVQSWNTDYGEEPGFTVDASDNAYAVNGSGDTRKFTSAGKDLGELDPSNENGSALGADLVSDYVFDAQHSFVAMYSGTATPPTKPLTTFGSGILSNAAGVTDNPSSRVVYVSDSSNDDVQMFQLPTPAAPSVDSESAANVTDIDAILNAEINPNFKDTTFQFQYGTSTKYGKTAPAHPVDIGGGFGDVLATTSASGLKPDTTYHFRVVAKNSINTTDGPDHTFKTYPSNLSNGLPDTRGYEMVTPPQKNSGEPYLRFGFQNTMQASTNGDAFAFLSLDAFPRSKFDGSFYLSTRGKTRWTTQNLIPPQSTEGSLLCPAIGPEMVAYSPHLTSGILEDGFNQPNCGTDHPKLVKGEPKGVQNLFLRDNATGTYKLISLNPVSGPPANATYDGGSTDLSHVVFDESAQLTSKAPSGDDLYEWSAGSVSLVTVLPRGKRVVGALADAPDGNAFGAVSADGSRVFFTANGNLYVRENGKTTVQIDAPASGAPGPGGGGQFLGASADGSKVFFMDDSSAGLTSNTQSGSGLNLYEWDNGTLTDLTAVAQANVDGRAALTGDASYLYFVADGSLATGATAGQPNLYLLHGGTTKFIATLSGSDSCDWTDSCLTARTSTNGQYLAFTSTNSLTGYDNTDQSSGSPDPEIFRYDAATGKLVCASCNPSGVAPSAGGATVNTPYTPLDEANGAYLQHYASNSGQVFFDTAEQLLPRDTNGVKDVYEWEPDGTGSCTSAAENHGCLYLLSGGTSVDPSLFLDASPSGSDVFLATTQQLVPADKDGAYDIYDARVDGGFASVPPPPPCTGEDCKPPPKPPPPLPPIATVTFHGPGNAPTVKEATYATKGSRFALRVRVPARGRIAASGAGVQSVHLSAARAGAYRLTVALTERTKSALKRRRKLRLTLKVSYAPTHGRRATATVKLTVKA